MKQIIKILIGFSFIGLLFLNISLDLSENGTKVKLTDLAQIALANGESGGGSGTYYGGYYNNTIVIYNYSGDLGVYLGSGKIPVGLTINIGASGSLTYCESSFWWWKKCYENLNGFTPFV